MFKPFKPYEFLLLLFCSIFVLAGLILIGTTPIRAVFFLLCFISQTMLGMILWLKAKQEWNPDFLQLVAVGIPIGMVSSTIMAQFALNIGLGAAGFYFASIIGIYGWLRESFLFKKVDFTDMRYVVRALVYGILISLPVALTYFRTNPQVTNGIIKYQIDIPFLASLTHAVTTWGGECQPSFFRGAIALLLACLWVGWLGIKDFEFG